MRGLELVVVLGVAVLVCSLVARRFRVAQPVLLFGCGARLQWRAAALAQDAHDLDAE